MTDTSSSIRVAATQFASTSVVDDNLDTCVRMIRTAAESSPDLIVLPEFCNHISVYDSADHCWAVALELDGRFLSTIAAEAQSAEAFVVLAVTLRHDDGTVTISNVMFDNGGNRVAISDKQVLMGNERQYLTPGTSIGPIIPSPFGPIAMYSCMEGVVFEPPRSLAIRGARVMTNSLNSFGLDEASLHIPVRAAENRVFIVAANKVGPLIPAERVEAFAEAMGIPPASLDGAGESQIVSPDGTVLAIAPRTGEAVIYADIDLANADSKVAAGGTDMHAARRPETYAPLGSRSADKPTVASKGKIIVTLGSSAHPTDIPQADVVVLPELSGVSADPGADPEDAVKQSERGVSGIAEHLSGRDGIVITTIVERLSDGLAHTAVAIGAEGLVASQRQLHHSGRHPWATVLADAVECQETPWGRYALLAGDDVLFPEAFRLAAIQGASVIFVSTHILDPWLPTLGIPERAAENRVHVLASSRLQPGIGGVAAILPPDMTLWLPDRTRPFDGTINHPEVTAATNKWTTLTVAPHRSKNKLVSAGTDLVNGRPVEGAGTSLTV